MDTELNGIVWTPERIEFYALGKRDGLRDGIKQGLLRAAEIADQYPGVYGNCPTAAAIRAEAEKEGK